MTTISKQQKARRIEVFRALQTFVSDDPTRGALCRVYVSNAGKTLEATNGLTGVRVVFEAAETMDLATGFFLPKDAMAKLKADAAPQPVTTSYTFPDLLSAIPFDGDGKAESREVGIDPALFGRFMCAMGAFADDGQGVKVTWGVNDSTPIRVDATAHDCHAVGVCMPMRLPRK